MLGDLSLERRLPSKDTIVPVYLVVEAWATFWTTFSAKNPGLVIILALAGQPCINMGTYVVEFEFSTTHTSYFV